MPPVQGLGRFHHSVFARFRFAQNLVPASKILGAQVGVQLSLDLIKHHLTGFRKHAVGGCTTLHDSAGPAGQSVFGQQGTLELTYRFELWQPGQGR